MIICLSAIFNDLFYLEKMKILSYVTPAQKRVAKIFLHTIYRLITGEKKIQSIYSLYSFKKKGCDTFFGYYDVTPFNEDSSQIIYIEKKKDCNSVAIILNTLCGDRKEYIAESMAWNWQQGCRLRWMPNVFQSISFNDYRDAHYFNRIIDLNTKKEKIIDWPLYDISADGTLGVSLDFERLGVLRPGYGYTRREYIPHNLDSTAIFIIDIERNKVLKTLTYEEIKSVVAPKSQINNCYLNHLSFSPSGLKFLFFWIEIIDGYHKASLAVYDIEKEVIIPLETEYKVSHYVWDNDNIVCTAYDTNYECNYFKYNVSLREKKMICEKSLSLDGHPSFYLDNNMILTDTYPDSNGFQYLKIVNINADKSERLLKIYSKPVLSVERRTDLHPRFNKVKDIICFDANVFGNRELFIMKIK